MYMRKTFCFTALPLCCGSVALSYNQHPLSLIPSSQHLAWPLFCLLLSALCITIYDSLSWYPGSHRCHSIWRNSGISQVSLHLERRWDLTGVTSPGVMANPQRRVLTNSLILQRRKLIFIKSKHHVLSSAFLSGHCILRWSTSKESRTNHSLSLPPSSLYSSFLPPAPSFVPYLRQRGQEPWRIVGLGRPYCSTIYFLITLPTAESLYFPERQMFSKCWAYTGSTEIKLLKQDYIEM